MTSRNLNCPSSYSNSNMQQLLNFILCTDFIGNQSCININIAPPSLTARIVSASSVLITFNNVLLILFCTSTLDSPPYATKKSPYDVSPSLCGGFNISFSASNKPKFHSLRPFNLVYGLFGQIISSVSEALS